MKLSEWVSTKFKANTFSTPCITWWRNSTVDCVNEWVVLYTNYFNFQFFYLHTFYKTNNIKTKPSTKVKTYIEISPIKGQINVPLWTHMGQKAWRKGGKTFIRCYNIALKFWDELNSNFVLSYFSSYSSIKMTLLSQKMWRKTIRQCI